MVKFTIEGGASVSFHDNTQLVKLNDGRQVQADTLQNGDVFIIRRDTWAIINSEPVVS